ncbi:alpha/beta hydrolase [Amycolatopsis rhabdoformis]|uniref:Alpha/beta hydrolase n=1 Tax=Amycolatopsis rhabdoformis TaxID=1448059 RepID=A0ABZ1I004_9PSEU|nr:alpha/beta hydrolase [Amycolatopsis rhabdoformis]WSE27123.1 alpha/beta hydrolase [Amycolatopsis rhabdoformis]
MISRRQFSQVVAGGAATAAVASVGSGAVASGSVASGSVASAAEAAGGFGALKQVQAGVLNIGYAELGPADGPVVILLHGWPYDIHSFEDVAPALAAQGYRVLVPYLRGYGTTTFRSGTTFRNAQQSAVAADVIALMDALHIRRAVLGGFDWGSRTAAAVAALWPRRVKALVLVSGYLVTNLKTQLQPLAPAAELGWWYQYYFATDRGVHGYTRDTAEFNKLIWQTVSPKWHFDDATYQRTAQSFTNPDHVAIVVHNYRWRLSLAKGEPQYAPLEAKLQQSPKIALPTLTIASDFDGAAADGSAYRKQFTGPYDHRVLTGIGHNVPQEAPAAFAKAVVDADRL